MARRRTLNVSLTSELHKFIDRRVATGRYQTASEVIREGLRLLEDRERATDRDLASVRKKIASGLRQARAGKLQDGNEFLTSLRQRTPRRRNAG